MNAAEAAPSRPAVLRETMLSLVQARERFPRFGKADRPISVACLTRWILHGIRLGDGTRARLEATKLGNRWVTSVEAIERFLVALTPSAGGAAQQSQAAPRPKGRPTKKPSLRGEEMLAARGGVSSCKDITRQKRRSLPGASSGSATANQ